MKIICSIVLLFVLSNLVYGQEVSNTSIYNNSYDLFEQRAGETGEESCEKAYKMIEQLIPKAEKEKDSNLYKYYVLKSRILMYCKNDREEAFKVANLATNARQQNPEAYYLMAYFATDKTICEEKAKLAISQSKKMLEIGVGDVSIGTRVAVRNCIANCNLILAERSIADDALIEAYKQEEQTEGAVDMGTNTHQRVTEIKNRLDQAKEHLNIILNMPDNSVSAEEKIEYADNLLSVYVANMQLAAIQYDKQLFDSIDKEIENLLKKYPQLHNDDNADLFGQIKEKKDAFSRKDVSLLRKLNKDGKKETKRHNRQLAKSIIKTQQSSKKK